MSNGEITELLQAIAEDDPTGAERFYESVYIELRRVARSLMRGERPGHTLQPTALVNEAFLRLVGEDYRWANRAHFFGAAARAMRRILVDHARRKVAEKRGGAATRVTFAEIDVASEDADIDILALEEALSALASQDERLAQVVELRYFAGCTNAEIAEILDRSETSIKRDWTYARAWLYERMMASAQKHVKREDAEKQ
jgi:RNA polymerase sigma factor (TIGR02999 family)